jgi:hypothetical protein
VGGWVGGWVGGLVGGSVGRAAQGPHCDGLVACVDPVHPAQSSLANTQAGIVDPQSHSVSQVELPKRLPIMAY